MHKPPHRYTTSRRSGVHLPANNRWGCFRRPISDARAWCGGKHTAKRYADNHGASLNEATAKGKPRYSPQRIYRIERYSAEQLHLRGWTDEMITAILGSPDAEDSTYWRVNEPRLYDADRVHDAEISPTFDQMAVHLGFGGSPTTFGADFTAIQQAVSMDVTLEIPSKERQALIKYARTDLQRMSDERTAKAAGLSVKRDIERIHTLNPERFDNHPEYDSMMHAAMRCTTGSRTWISFARKYRRHQMAHKANQILAARMANAVCQVAPTLSNYLVYDITSQDNDVPHLGKLPAPGQPLSGTSDARVNQCGQEQPTQQFQNITNLRWANYQTGPTSPPTMPPWGTVTVTTTDGSLDKPFHWKPPLPTGTST